MKDIPTGYISVSPVEVGEYSYIGNFSHISQYTTIGRYCGIGNLCTIGAQPHPTDQLTTFPIGHLVDGVSTMCQRTIIENDVWIGANVVVKSGLRIGNGAIIGAGSVVTRAVPDYAIMAGNPARMLRWRFPADVISELMDTRWWEFPIDIVKKLPFRDIHASIIALRELRKEAA